MENLIRNDVNFTFEKLNFVQMLDFANYNCMTAFN